MDNASAPTEASLHVHSFAEMVTTLPTSRRVNLNDIQAVHVVHRNANNRDRDQYVYIKGQSPTRLDPEYAPWSDYQGLHTVDMMKKTGAKDIVAIKEPGYQDSNHIYNSRTLHVRLDAVTRIEPSRKAPHTESQIHLEGQLKPVQVLAPIRDLVKIPGLARLTQQEPPVR